MQTTKATQKEIAAQMVDVIDAVEVAEGVQIIVDDNRLNSYARDIYKDSASLTVKLIAWRDLLASEVDRLRNNQHSDIIVKINA